MMKLRRFFEGSFLLLVVCASAAPAQGVQRTFVSGLGNDGNACSRTAPCRTFAQAISQTSAGGEVYVLDTAGYGPFTINKSVSIVAPLGVTAGISVFSGDGIDINAGSSDTVVLRGLTVNNQGSSGDGIHFNSGGTLHIESCVVNGFSNFLHAGVFFKGAGNLQVKDSVMRGNSLGIIVLPSSGTALAAIDQVRLEDGGDGLVAEGGSKVTVRDSIASGNVIGFVGDSQTAAAAELNVENCVASNNSATGIVAQSLSTGAVTVRVSNSTVTDNTVGLQNAGSPAVLLSRGNNTVEGNGTNTSGTIGSYSAK